MITRESTSSTTWLPKSVCILQGKLKIYCTIKFAWDIVTLTHIYSLAPRRFERNSGEVILKLILVIDGLGISCEIVLTWTPQDLTDDKSTLVQVMAWCRQATSHYLSQYWPCSLSPYGITRPEWVKDGNGFMTLDLKCQTLIQLDLLQWSHYVSYKMNPLNQNVQAEFPAILVAVKSSDSRIKALCMAYVFHCTACRTTLVATRFRVAVICPIIQVPHCIRVFFYFVWFVFINHIFQFYYELCTYCNILDIYLS